ncbi:hypothetical protein MNBD_BACTEROID01-2119 [hydrothermal vent metagenome]|uniref:Collagen-binding domain-containing protein n=1 Tax=hydrothermal vent metagenome TaxID=652676 RepID=A0A3B0TX43_9ZZZZ
MKQIFYILFFVILSIFSGCFPNQGNKSDFSNDIRLYIENPKYWQYKGKPVLLLGASNSDNLFQSPDFEEQLDLLKSIGGNYVRNTMKSSYTEIVWPYYRLKDGKYDLNKWGAEYWKRFEKLLKLADERDIIVQVEIWDRFLYSRKSWIDNPFNPANNINYSVKECGMETEYPVHPYRDLQPFFHTIKGMSNYTPALELVKNYQEKFVDKILSYSLKYGNVLYCMDNETTTPPEWGLYWMRYIRDKAGEKRVYTTDMFDHFFYPNTCESCKQAIGNPEEYLFLDVSQINSRIYNQAHWDTLQWIVNERDKYPIRPVNCVKIYGGNYKSYGTGSNEDGVERFCRDVIGGCAAVRHCSPLTGNGLNKKAQATIKAVRKVESLVKMWEVEPHMELLSEREEDEAYLTADEGSKYVVLFPQEGSVKIDLSKYNKQIFTGKWISIKSGEWGKQFSVSGGGNIDISTPDSSGWFAVLVCTF